MKLTEEQKKERARLNQKIYYEAHKEEVKAKRRERYNSDPEYQKQYNRDHKEYYNQKVKDYQKRHKDLYNFYQKKYQKSHPELHINYNVGLSYRISKNFTCEICGFVGNAGTTISHHIIKLSNGGLDNKENIICLCRKCHNDIDRGEDNE